jgi:hypothetical protein
VTRLLQAIEPATIGTRGRFIARRARRTPSHEAAPISLWHPSGSAARAKRRRRLDWRSDDHCANWLPNGPLSALRYLVDLLGRDETVPPLRPGEIVATGTLTRALPVAPGERWSTRLEGVPLRGISLDLR